jgi:hypothetical protein
MVKHIVCFKLKNNSESEINRAKEVLLSMDGKVPTVRKIEVGTDFLHSNRSYDIYLAVDLDDRAALEEYANDQYHCDVVKAHMHTVVESSITVDYEY